MWLFLATFRARYLPFAGTRVNFVLAYWAREWTVIIKIYKLVVPVVRKRTSSWEALGSRCESKNHGFSETNVHQHQGVLHKFTLFVHALKIFIHIRPCYLVNYIYLLYF